MEENKDKISCPTFQKQESVIKDSTDKMNGAKRAQEKAGFAATLDEEVDVLLRCQDYDKAKHDCNNCHLISTLRRKASHLIIRAGALKRC